MYLLVYVKLNRIHLIGKDEVTQNAHESEGFENDKEVKENLSEGESLDPKEVKWELEGIDVMNILLIGQDRREGQRSDSMIICNINRESGKIILSSVMRDLYVPIPGYSDNCINAAYQFGGMRCWTRSSRRVSAFASTAI